MEEEVEKIYNAICTTCLSSDRVLTLINGTKYYEVFNFLLHDYSNENIPITLKTEMDQLVCWECLASMRKIDKFKRQVHSVQEHLQVTLINRTNEIATFNELKTLSTLQTTTKNKYDSIFFDYITTTDENATTMEWSHHLLEIDGTQGVKAEQFDLSQVVRESEMALNMDEGIYEVPLEVNNQNVENVMSELVLTSDHTYGTVDDSQGTTVNPMTLQTIMICQQKSNEDSLDNKETVLGFTTVYMTEDEMNAERELMQEDTLYKNSVYKCELCIISFKTQLQVEDHFVLCHKNAQGLHPCRICYSYVRDAILQKHIDQHFIRLWCRQCGLKTKTIRDMNMHIATHENKSKGTVIAGVRQRKSDRKKIEKPVKKLLELDDMKKLMSKTTIEGYPCVECNMFFKNSRARKNHVDRYHREGLQCDVCKKRFVNKTTLATHLRLHEGPLPRKECPVCHKMVRVIQLKYHVRRHESRGRYECVECAKVFSHLATYSAHLKYSRQHATDHVLKFPCPMCDKAYSTKETMQDHFNYQHLNKTTHKCPVCSKPIATKANVEKHMMRVHGEKKAKPRNHTCQICGKTFTDKKSLTQHAVIHSGDRPLTCDVCFQTFKQKASLYTHRKRVHKIVPPKKIVQFIPENGGIANS